MNFKNRPTFAKVTVKIKVAQFFLLTVYIPGVCLYGLLIMSRITVVCCKVLALE